jgi:hypothetical protein
MVSELAGGGTGRSRPAGAIQPGVAMDALPPALRQG